MGVTRRFLKIMFLVLMVISLFGCRSYQINANIEGKEISQDASGKYYLSEYGRRKYLNVTNHDKRYTIDNIVQNGGHGSTGMLISGPFNLKDFLTPWKIKKTALLITKGKVVYSKETRQDAKISWDADCFVIHEGDNAIFLRPNGKPIRDKSLD